MWSDSGIGRGHNIGQRVCPILENKIVMCPPVWPREGVRRLPTHLLHHRRMGWFRVYSDGKFILTTEFGG